MGWVLTGDMFPKAWQREWKRACAEVVGEVGDFRTGNDRFDLNFVRHVVQRITPIVSPGVLWRVMEESSPECFEAPAMSIQDLRQAAQGLL